MSNLKGRDLKGVADFSAEEIEFTLEVSRQLKLDQKIGRPHRLLEGKTLAGIFETQSTRTSISFETAMTQLGGHMIYLDENRMWVGKAAEEDWHDTIMTIDRYADAIAHRAIMREPSWKKPPSTRPSRDQRLLSRGASLSGLRRRDDHDGEEGLAEEGESRAMLGIPHGQPSRGAHELDDADGWKARLRTAVACPEGFESGHGDQGERRQGGRRKSAGASSIVRSYEEAIKDADFVNVYSWVSPTCSPKDWRPISRATRSSRESKKKLKKDWCVTKKAMDNGTQGLQSHACLPVSRTTR